MPDEPTIGVDERDLDDAALEALAAIHATAPPPGARERLLARAAREAAAARALRRWRLGAALAATLALALAGLLARGVRLGGDRAAEMAALQAANATLYARIDAQGRRLAALQEAFAAQAQVLRVLSGPRTLVASLAPTEGGPGRGRVLVDEASGETAVVLTGVRPPAAGTVYELWAIRGERAPEPAGLLAVGAEETVALRAAPLERPREVTAFAVSVEPEGGSPAPTGPIVLAGAVAG